MEVTATPLPFGRMQSGRRGWQHQNKASISAARNQASNNDHVNKKLLGDILLDTHKHTHIHLRKKKCNADDHEEAKNGKRTNTNKLVVN